MTSSRKCHYSRSRDDFIHRKDEINVVAKMAQCRRYFLVSFLSGLVCDRNGYYVDPENDGNNDKEHLFVCSSSQLHDPVTREQ